MEKQMVNDETTQQILDLNMSFSAFTAGPSGKKIRSDCQVSFKPSNQPLKIEVSSKVDVLFGASLRNLTEASLARSEEHTSELQSHSFISYAVFCLKKKKKQTTQ